MKKLTPLFLITSSLYLLGQALTSVPGGTRAIFVAGTTAGHFASFDANGFIIDGGSAPGTGTVSSVGWTGGLVSVANSTTTPAFTVAGTSGGVPCFTSSSTWASSGALASGQFLLGGGAGACPTASFSVVPVTGGGTGIGSTLVGIMRGNASAMTAAELSGDATTSSSNAVTVAKVNGVVYPASPTTFTHPVVTSSGTVTYETSSYVPAGCVTGTSSSTTNSASEVNLAVCTIPAGYMGTNGSLQITTLWKFVGTAGIKTPRIRFSGTSGDTSGGSFILDAATNSTDLGQKTVTDLWNVNSASVQISGTSNNARGVGTQTVVLVTGAVNTASAAYVNFNCLTANSGDTCAIVAYKVLLTPK